MNSGSAHPAKEEALKLPLGLWVATTALPEAVEGLEEAEAAESGEEPLAVEADELMIAEEAETADEDAIEDDVATTVEVGTDWDWRLSRGEAEDERARAPRTNAAVMATIFSFIRRGFLVTVLGTSNSAVDSFSTL